MRTGLLHFANLSALLILTITASPARSDDDPIALAVKKGAKYLQGVHKPDKNYSGGAHGMGSATLAGMALLESGVPETDASLQNIIRYVRDNALAQTRTYELSLTIMFLDRLGHSADRPIIQFLGVRLMAGQGTSGGWSYDCGYPLGAQDESRLKALFRESRLVATPAKIDAPKPDPKKSVIVETQRPDLPPEPTPPPPEPKAKIEEKKEAPPKPADQKPTLHPEVVRFAKMINQEVARIGRDPGAFGDNSNTQFATLGLWCARKHGVPCENAIALIETRFRTSQDADGGWAYNYRNGGAGSTAAMTCAGLIGLAVAHGAHHGNGKKGPAEDAAIKNGLKCLGNYITEAKGLPPEGKINPAKRRARFKVDNLNANLYFLWSMERVAVIFGLETIGKHDWYIWGSDALVDSQNANGSWTSHHFHGASEEISTSFALLFLNRANVAKDLTNVLQGKIGDPGVAVLRSADPSLIKPKTEPKRDQVATTNPQRDPMTVTPSAQADVNSEAAQLCASLFAAAGDARAAIVVKLRDSKGSVHTEALARAAARATDDFQREVREALARRLTRMTPATLREMLKDEEREVRRGAALACGYKKDQQFLADLIEVLNDREDLVIQAARSSLRSLSGKDLGPEANAKPSERQKAAVDWKTWLKARP